MLYNFNITRYISLVFLGPLLLSGCVTAPVENFNGQHVESGKTVSVEQVRNAILAAGKVSRWKIQEVSPGLFMGTYRYKRHNANVDIKHDTKTYSIKYHSSSNLRYDGFNIHKRYNEWVNRLDRAIRTELYRVSSSGQSNTTNSKASGEQSYNSTNDVGNISSGKEEAQVRNLNKLVNNVDETKIALSVAVKTFWRAPDPQYEIKLEAIDYLRRNWQVDERAVRTVPDYEFWTGKGKEINAHNLYRRLEKTHIGAIGIRLRQLGGWRGEEETIVFAVNVKKKAVMTFKGEFLNLESNLDKAVRFIRK